MFLAGYNYSQNPKKSGSSDRFVECWVFWLLTSRRTTTLVSPRSPLYNLHNPPYALLNLLTKSKGLPSKSQRRALTSFGSYSRFAGVI